jgi:hypothetical protein
MAASQDLRIGDAEREAAAASLREHYAQGRLSLEEFNQRLDAVFHAVTQGGLDRITRDLPHVAAAAVPLPDTGQRFAGGRLPGGGRRGGGWHGGGRSGGGRRQAALRRGMTLVSLALVLLVVTLWHASWWGLGGRIPFIMIAVVVFRILMRLLFGRRRMGRGRGGW